MTPNDEVEPKECPFCGGEASESIGKMADESPFLYIECLECGANADPDIWNIRKQSPSSGLRLDDKEIENAIDQEIVWLNLNVFSDREQIQLHTRSVLSKYIRAIILSKFGTKQEMPTVEEIDDLLAKWMMVITSQYSIGGRKELAKAVLALFKMDGK